MNPSAPRPSQGLKSSTQTVLELASGLINSDTVACDKLVKKGYAAKSRTDGAVQCDGMAETIA
jgi:hypothetical protein